MSLVILLALSGPAAAAEVDLEIVAEDFELSSDTERSLRRILVRVFRTYENTLGLTFPSTVPVHIRLVADRGRYDAQVPGTLRHMRTAGFFSSALGEGVVWRAPDESFTRSTIVHETSHYLLDVAGARVPLWLNEGLAETVGTARADGNAVWLEPQSIMVDWMHRNPSDVPTVEHLLRGSADDWRALATTPLGSPHHGFGWAVCAFLMSSSQGKETLEQLIVNTSVSRSPDVAVQAIEDRYRGGLTQLERDYKAWWSGSPGKTQLPIPVAGVQEAGWRTCSDGRLVKEGSGMTCGRWVPGSNGVMTYVEE